MLFGEKINFKWQISIYFTITFVWIINLQSLILLLRYQDICNMSYIQLLIYWFHEGIITNSCESKNGPFCGQFLVTFCHFLANFWLYVSWLNFRCKCDFSQGSWLLFWCPSTLESAHKLPTAKLSFENRSFRPIYICKRPPFFKAYLYVYT
jgi:hypothetical protein